jgi:hypothetical protein
MLTQKLKKAFSPLFLFATIAGFAALGAGPQAARADYYPTTCGVECVGYGGGTMLNPFIGLPQFSAAYGGAGYGGYGGYGGGYYQTGQMPDPRMMMEQQLVAMSYRPMGTTYSPVVGLDAININQASMALGF